MRTSTLLAITLPLLLTSAALRKQGEASPSSGGSLRKESARRVAAAKAEIEAFPRWTQLQRKDRAGWEEFERACSRLAGYQSDTLQEALLQLAAKYRAPNGDGIVASLDLYPLNRFLFVVDAPLNRNTEKRSPWPWYVAKSGEIHLADTFHGWGGGVLDPVKEFVELRRAYPRRVVQEPKNSTHKDNGSLGSGSSGN